MTNANSPTAVRETAADLLKEIAKEREALIKAGKMKKAKPLPEITEDEIPYAIPENWEWVRLGDVCNKLTDGTHHSPTNTTKGDYKYITAKNIKKHGIDLSDITYVSNEIHKEIYSRCNPVKGDVLIIKDGATTGVATINTLEEEFSLLSSVALLKPPLGIDAQYLVYMFESPSSQQYIKDDMAGAAITRLTITKLEKFPFPLPPLSVQKRIVALLDELLSRIDKARENIEKNIENAEELYENSVETVFAEFEEEYRCVRLSDVCHYDKIKNTTPNLPYVGLEHIESNTGKFLGELTPTEVLSSTFHFSDTHLLYGRLRPYLNKALLPTFEGHCSTEIFPISVHEEITREYLFYWITKKSIVKRIDETWTGARMPRANMNIVLEFELPIPPLKKQQEIVSTLDKIKENKEHLLSAYTKKLQALDELRNSVLEKAFRGELT